MSSRFHNKYHRHNHHTTALDDPRYPDASHDPIASPDSPFLGPFVLYGPLSAVAVPPQNVFQTFGLSEPPPAGIFIAPQTSAIAVDVVGSIQATGSITFGGNIVVSNSIVAGYGSPLVTTGEFLQISVNGSTRYIRLWNFY